MHPELFERDFHPELAPRRGEWIAWGCALLTSAAWLILLLSQVSSPIVPILAGFLLLVALSISLGNWMDRRTVLRLEADGVAFQNGLRRVWLKWDEIQQVRVVAGLWSEKVQVLGANAGFTFQTLGQVQFQGTTHGQVGFQHGRQILDAIVASSHLRLQPQPGSGRLEGSYYVRE